MQAKLLRFLESGEIRRVGENQPIICDVRVICATHRNLEEMVESGDFREDLWFRINTFEIRLPSLRERLEDIPVLVRHLVSRFRKNLPPDVEVISAEALSELEEHCWPGNVRELANVIEHALILCDRLPIRPEHLPSRFSTRRLRRPEIAAVSTEVRTLREIEMQAINDALHRHHGNKPKAADELGISLKTLYNKLNQDSALGKSA
jgi:DNA-binding NtrC family response regulator